MGKKNCLLRRRKSGWVLKLKERVNQEFIERVWKKDATPPKLESWSEIGLQSTGFLGSALEIPGPNMLIDHSN